MLPTANSRQVAMSPVVDSLNTEWLLASFALAYDLLTELEYGPVIATAIAQVQTLLEADSASICLSEIGDATVQYVSVQQQEVTSVIRPAGSLSYPQLVEDTVIQRHETCTTCRLLPSVAWCASAPIYVEGQQIGMLCAARKAQRPSFNREQMSMLRLLALWLAIAISNARRVRTTQEMQRNQREQIAAHLHDNTAQSVNVIGLKVDQVENTLGVALSEDLAQQLRTIKNISQQLMVQVRTAFSELRQAEPQPGDLVSALAGCIDNFTQTALLPVEFSVSGVCTLPSVAQTQAVLVVREALNNVARHAQAHCVQVKLLGDNESVRIIVQDDGVGFDPQSLGADQRHLGAILMHERAQRSGGSVQIDSHPGRGTQVTLTYPVTLQP